MKISENLKAKLYAALPGFLMKKGKPHLSFDSILLTADGCDTKITYRYEGNDIASQTYRGVVRIDRGETLTINGIEGTMDFHLD